MVKRFPEETENHAGIEPLVGGKYHLVNDSL